MKFDFYAIVIKAKTKDDRLFLRVRLLPRWQYFFERPIETRDIKAKMELRAVDGNRIYGHGFLSRNQGMEKISLPRNGSLSYGTDYFLVAHLTLPDEPFKGRYKVKKGGCPLAYFR